MKLQITLRSRLVMLVILAIVPLFGLALGKAWFGANTAISRATGSLMEAASLVAARQEGVVESAQQLLTAISQVPGLVSGSNADCQRYLKTLHAQLAAYANLGLISLDGIVRCDGLGNGRGVFAGDREYFQAALAQRRFVASGYIFGRTTGKSSINFALPVLDSEGKVSAVAFAAVDLSELSKVVAEVALPPGGELVISDNQGIVLAANPGKSATIGQRILSPELREVVQTKRGGTGEGPDGLGRERLFALLPIGKSANFPFCVALSVDRGSVIAASRKDLALELALLALLALLGGRLAWGMAGRAIIKPTTDILEATGRLQRGQLDARIAIKPRDGVGEFSKIADSVNRMADALQTQHDALQAELASSQTARQRLRDAQRLGRIGYWQVALSDGLIWWSDEVYELQGVDRAHLGVTDDGFFERIHPDDRAEYIARRSAARVAGKTFDIEFRIITLAGEVRWIHLLGRDQVDNAGEKVTRRSGVLQDITERKLAEQTLRDNERRYAALFDAAPVPMYAFASDSNQFLAVNQAMIQGYGYSAEEFLAMTLFDIHEPAQHNLVRQKLADEAPRRQAIWRYRRKDGSVFPAKAVAQSIQYAGRAARFVVALDISAQVRAENEVAEHLFTLQRAADAAQAITWHQTLQGTLQEVAEQARGVIGAHQAIVSITQGNDWAHALNALSLSDKYTQYRELRQHMDGSGIYALVCETNHSMRLTQAELEAHPRWRGFGSHAATHPPMRGWLAVPLIGRDGKNIGVLQLSDKYEGEFTQPDEYVALELAQLASGAIENARLIEEVGQLNSGLEQKVAERTAALVRQEAMFRALSDQAPQVVWMTKPNGSVTYANHAWFDLVGGTVDDWLGDKWIEVIHPEDLPAVKANWLAASTDLSLFSGIRRLRAKDGSYHTMAYRASPVLDAQGKVLFWVGIDADISEVKAIEAALRLANQELEAFSYSVSHDLRSPLSSIDGFSQLLAKQIDTSGNDKLRHYLSRIQAGAKQMGQLIADLLALSQVSRAQLRVEPVDLSALAHGILAECQLRQPARQLVLHIESGMRVQADAGLLRVVLDNLLGNAWKFSALQARAEISVGQALDAAGQQGFFVRDNGVGFDMAYADKLFTPFQRLHAVSEFAGTGIGLATVKRVIDRHGGRLWAESAPGRGATFFFTLPKWAAVV